MLYRPMHHLWRILWIEMIKVHNVVNLYPTRNLQTLQFTVKVITSSVYEDVDPKMVKNQVYGIAMQQIAEENDGTYEHIGL